MRREYELTEEQTASLLDACSPVVCIKVGDYAPRSPQENANAAWSALGADMGFDYLTVKPVPGKGQCFFTADEAVK